MNTDRFARLATTEVILFLALWLIYGMAMNSKNLQDFNLQQAGVEAMVERRHFFLEGSSTPELQSIGDTFLYQGHVYANKHPGQFMAGAVVYSILRLVGLRYSNNYLLVAALVTFFTASLTAAAAGIAVFKLSDRFSEGRSRTWAIVATLVFGLGTTILPYSGIAHHDTIATGYLIIAFYLIFSLSRDESSKHRRILKAAIAGLLLGLTVTTSMLLFFMVLVVGLYFLTLRQWKLLAPFAVAAVAGLMPLLIYDAVNFGDPFLLPAIANYKFNAYDPEVFFHFEMNNFVHKTIVYSEFITLYAPVLWLGVFGFFFFPQKYHREKYVVGAAVIVLYLYVSNVQGLGSCNYGPRYLLPIMPFVSLGIIGLQGVPSRAWRYTGAAVLIVVGFCSVVINLTGAIKGAMYCNLARYAFPDYVQAVVRGDFGSYPLLRWLLPFVALLVALVFCKAFMYKNVNKLPGLKPSNG